MTTTTNAHSRSWAVGRGTRPEGIVLAQTQGAGAASGGRWRRASSPGGSAAGQERLLLMLDNYDSFTYNLVHLFQELGVEVRVFRNDAITADEAEGLAPTTSSSPPRPARGRRRLRRADPAARPDRPDARRLPVGHQAIVEAFSA